MSQIQRERSNDMDVASNKRFEMVAATTSNALLQHTSDLSMVVKQFHLETESLRAVKESLHAEMVQFLKAELDASATSFGNKLFIAFSSKAMTFLDGRFSAVNRANDDLQKTLYTWSNLSLKSISLLALSSILVGVFSFFVSHYLMPGQKLTEAELKCIYYGKAYVMNSDKFPESINRFVAEEANKLVRNATH